MGVIVGFRVLSLPCKSCAGSARCTGGAPSSSSSWIWGFLSSCSGMTCTGSASCRTGGSPPSSGLSLRAVGSRSQSPAPSFPCAVCAPSSSSSCLGGFPSSCSVMPCAGSARCRIGGFPPSSRITTGVGVPSTTLGLPWASPLIPPPSVRLAVGGGLLRSWGLPPPISCIRPRPKGVRACSGGAPPSPLGWMVPSSSPPCPCMPCAGGARCSGGPLVAILGFGGLPLPCMPCAGSAHCLGDPPSSSSWFRESPPSLTGIPCAGIARCCSAGVPPFLRARPAHGGCARPVPIPLLPVRRLHTLLGMGAPLFVLGPVVGEGYRAALFGGPPMPPR